MEGPRQMNLRPHEMWRQVRTGTIQTSRVIPNFRFGKKDSAKRRGRNASQVWRRELIAKKADSALRQIGLHCLALEFYLSARLMVHSYHSLTFDPKRSPLFPSNQKTWQSSPLLGSRERKLGWTAYQGGHDIPSVLKRLPDFHPRARQ